MEIKEAPSHGGKSGLTPDSDIWRAWLEQRHSYLRQLRNDLRRYDMDALFISRYNIFLYKWYFY
jgi:hypothetical protein